MSVWAWFVTNIGASELFNCRYLAHKTLSQPLLSWASELLNYRYLTRKTLSQSLLSCMTQLLAPINSKNSRKFCYIWGIMLARNDIEGLARGEVEAFRRIYDTMAPRLLYYLHRITGRRDAAEDLAHEVFVLLWERRAAIGDIVDLKAWLFTVAHNHMRNYVRTRGLHSRIIDSIEVSPEIDHELVVTAEMCGVVRGVVHSLPGQTRRVIELAMQGMSVAEIARQMEVSANTVKTLKKSGYSALREKLGHLRALFFML